MIDCARQLHSVGTLKQVIQLCRLYKIRYLQLHLTDDQGFMFPSTAFPLLTTQNQSGPAYTLDELRELLGNLPDDEERPGGGGEMALVSIVASWEGVHTGAVAVSPVVWAIGKLQAHHPSKLERFEAFEARKSR